MADETTGMYDYFLSELDKVSKIDVTVKSLKKEQKQLVVDVEEVKEFVGIEENEKDSNVIDKDKLPAVLTGNEKKRYENIGKQFVEGAGKEFIRIKNAIKFKSNMSTVRDSFLKGFDKIKSSVKTMTRKSGFWKKLLGIVSLLTIVAYVFRDKIAKMMPNVGGKIKEILESGKEMAVTLIKEIAEKITGSVEKNFGAIIKHMLTDTLPAIVGNFFQYTLPNVLLQTWLTVLSTFSSSAQERLSEEVSNDMSITSEQVADGADAMAKAEVRNIVGNTEEQSGGEIEAVLELQRKMRVLGQQGQVTDVELRDFMRRAGVAAVQNENQKNSAVMTTLDSLVDAVSGIDVDLKTQLDQGQFDISNFLAQYKSRVENDADKETAIIKLFAESLNWSAEQTQKALQDENIRRQVSAKLADENTTKIINNLITTQNNLQQEAADIIKLNNDRANAISREEEKVRELAKQPPVQIDFNNVFDTHMTDTLNDVLVTLTKFINGDSKELQNYIILGMNKVAGFYKQFLDSSLDVLYKATEGIGNLMDGTSIASNVPQTISGNNNIIINIDLSDSAANSYTAAVTALSETENKIVTAIDKTNIVLTEVVEKVSALNGLHAASVQYVDGKDKELHTIMDAKEALVWGQVNKNKNDITVIRNSLQNSSMSPTRNENVPIVMLGNVR